MFSLSSSPSFKFSNNVEAILNAGGGLIHLFSPREGLKERGLNRDEGLEERGRLNRAFTVNPKNTVAALFVIKSPCSKSSRSLSE